MHGSLDRSKSSGQSLLGASHERGVQDSGLFLQGTLFILINALCRPELGMVAGTMGAVVIKAIGGVSFPGGEYPPPAFSDGGHAMLLVRQVRVCLFFGGSGLICSFLTHIYIHGIAFATASSSSASSTCPGCPATPTCTHHSFTTGFRECFPFEWLLCRGSTND